MISEENDEFLLKISQIHWGIAPIATKSIKLLIRSSFNYKSLQLINLQNFELETNLEFDEKFSTQVATIVSDFVNQKLSGGRYAQTEVKKISKTLIDGLENYWVKIFSTFHQLKNRENSEFSKILQKILVKDIFENVLSSLLKVSFNPREISQSAIFNLFKQGYIPYFRNDELYIFYGFSFRTEFFEDMLFGKPEKVALQNLYAVIKHKVFKSGTSKILKSENSEMDLRIRKSDTIQLMFRVGQTVNKLQKFENLAQIPCRIEIFFATEIDIFSKNRQKFIAKKLMSEHLDDKKQEASEVLENLLTLVCNFASERANKLEFSQIPELITQKILHKINKFKNLKELNLNQASIKFSDLASLNGLQKLEKLGINEIRIENNETNMFDNFPKLQKISAQNSPQILKLLESSNLISRISSLDLSCKNIPTKLFENFPEMLNLQELKLVRSDFSTVGDNFFSKTKSLQTLILKDSKISSNSIHCIAQLDDKLETLDISTNTFDTTLVAEDFNCLAMLHNLRNLDVSGRPISDYFIQLLSENAAGIRILNLSYTFISNLALEFMRRFQYLTELNLEGCRQINDFGIEILMRNCSGLKIINLQGTSASKNYNYSS